MSGWAEGYIRAFGAAITVKTAQTPDGRQAKGFVLPIQPGDADKARRVSPGGIYDRERYSLIAEPAAISAGETDITVSCGTGEYELLRLEQVCVGPDVSHLEGVMRLKSGVRKSV